MLRQLTWSTMTNEDKDWIWQRGAATTVSNDLEQSIRDLVEDVRSRGDQAVCDALATFDGVQVEPAGLRVAEAEFAAAAASLDPSVNHAIQHMIANITAFNTALKERRSSWQTEISPGHVVGETIGPIASTALFCPSGKASYPSVLAQVATPAVVAGVPQIVAIVPPVPGGQGEIDPAVLMVAHHLGITNVFRVNGPSGVAAAAFGTEHIPAVGKIIGPGSPAVALAQLEVRRHGVDTVVLGPTESLIIADASADPRLLAADLLNEAEHGTDSTVVLVTPQPELLAPTIAELEAQAAVLPPARQEAARAALGSNGGAIVVDDLDQAYIVANWFAAEHVQLAIEDAPAAIERIEHAGEVLVGQSTPLSAGNFLIGAPAALPTGGYATRASGVTVETFQKATSIGQLNAEALHRVAQSTIALSNHEGFPAHTRAITIRTED